MSLDHEEITINEKGLVKVVKLCGKPNDSVFGFSERHYRKVAAQGGVPEPVNGFVHFLTACSKLIQHYRDSVKGKNDEDLTHYKTELAKENAKIKNLKRRELEAELLNVEIVKKVVSLVLGNIRGKMLQMPSNISQLIPNNSTIKERNEIIEEVVHEALLECGLPDFEAIARVENNKSITDDTETTTEAEG